jgi:hypothetical protein
MQYDLAQKKWCIETGTDVTLMMTVPGLRAGVQVHSTVPLAT